MSVKNFACNSRVRNGCANFMGAWDFFGSFCKRTSRPILVWGGRFRGGGVFWVLGRGGGGFADFILVGEGIFLSDNSIACTLVRLESLMSVQTRYLNIIRYTTHDTSMTEWRSCFARSAEVSQTKPCLAERRARKRWPIGPEDMCVQLMGRYEEGKLQPHKDEEDNNRRSLCD